MAEAILLGRDVDDNARIVAQLSAKNNRRFDALNQAAVAAVRTVVSTGATMEERLHALSAQVMEVTNYDIHQGARGPWSPPSFSVGACMGWSRGSRHSHPFTIERTSSSTFSPRPWLSRP
jgi:hypothetical protein